MSSLCKQLRRIWQTKRASTPLPTKPTPSPAAEKPPRRRPARSTNELFKEPNVEVMATKLKLRSSSYYFRSKINVYSYAIDRLAKQKRFSAIEDILEFHKKYPEINREGYAARLISLYGDAGMFEHAHKLFDELPELQCERKTLAFNALMGAGLHSREFQRVVDVFNKYPTELGIKPDVVSYNTVIRVLGELGRIDEAMSMVNRMENDGLEPNVVTLNALLTGAYGKKGVEEGDRIWQFMLEKKGDLVPDIRSYNAKLQGMIDEGMILDAVELYDELKIRGLRPNAVSYNHLIKGFCDRGDLEEAKKWYQKLLDSKWLPTKATFDTLIRLLCEDGDSELALDLSKRMLGRYYMVDQDLLQMVVDSLVKDSKHEEAQKLVECARANVFCQYNLVMPSET